MKIKSSDTRQFKENLITSYQFDKLDSVDDVIQLIGHLQNSGISIDHLIFREFGDYEDAPLVATYRLSNIENVYDDFMDKDIETCLIAGEYGEYSVAGTVFFRENRLEMKYLPTIKNQLDEMFQKSEFRDEKSTGSIIK